MEKIAQIPAQFIEENTIFSELISELKTAFSINTTLVPMRHHHDFPNPEVNAETTLLLMPAWNPSKNTGVKIVTVSPENSQYDLPSVNGTYIFLDAVKGTIKAILEAKSLTAKRTSAASALASSFLSRKDASSFLMIGTGALFINLIKAHAAVRPIKKVYVWGRNFDKAQAIADELKKNPNDYWSNRLQNIYSTENKCKEKFILKGYENASSVILYGNFNEWRGYDNVCKLENGVWITCVNSNEKKLLYRFKVDDKWVELSKGSKFEKLSNGFKVLVKTN